MSDDLVMEVAQPTGLVNNPFGSVTPAPSAREAAVESAVQREVAEVQGAVVVAHRFPRNQIAAMDRILQACTRVSLAEQALYSYSRGGNEISGPSIRLAEVLAQNWGNINFGTREIEQRAYAGRPGESTVVSYCWDLETNVRDERVFQVKHVRHARENVTTLTDTRDIYEAVANQGARRLRACILAVIPGDVVETAVQQCEATLLAKADTSPEAVGKLVKAFEPFGVSKAQIEARIQRRVDTIRPAQIIQLRKVWSSLNDGMSVPGDWFQPTPKAADEPEPEAKGSAGLKQKLRAPAPKDQLPGGPGHPDFPKEGIDAPLMDEPPQSATEYTQGREPGEEG